MAELSPFDTRKLDNTKRHAVPIEEAYFLQRAADGIVLKTRYRNTGSTSQWGNGGDRSGHARQKKAGAKSLNRIRIRITASGKRVKEVMTEEEASSWQGRRG